MHVPQLICPISLCHPSFFFIRDLVISSRFVSRCINVFLGIHFLFILSFKFLCSRSHVTYWYSSCQDSAMSLFFHTPVQKKILCITGNRVSLTKTNLTHWFYCSAAVSHSCLYLSETVKKMSKESGWWFVMFCVDFFFKKKEKSAAACFKRFL